MWKPIVIVCLTLLGYFAGVAWGAFNWTDTAQFIFVCGYPVGAGLMFMSWFDYWNHQQLVKFYRGENT